MAHLNGKPGRYARSQAEKIYARMVLAIATGGVLFGVLIGFMFAYRHTLLIGLILAAVIFILIGLAVRYLQKPLDTMARQRIKYWRGAQAEALVTWLLIDLPESWHIFSGVMLQEGWDIDQIVVGPGGLFCISTKSCRGCFSLSPNNQPLLNSQPTDFPHEALRQTMELRSRLKALLGDDVPYVQAVLAVPFAYTDCPAEVQYVWIRHQENLLESLAPENKPPRLSPKEIMRIADALSMLGRTAKSIYRPPPSPPTPPASAPKP